MKTGERLSKAASRVLVALLAVTMVFTMMPLSCSPAYAESGSALSTQTPALVVTGKGLIGDDGVYSSSNVSKEKSYTVDELKSLGEDYVVNRQKYSAMKNAPFTKNYFLVDGVRVAALLGKAESEITDDVYVVARDGYKVEFLQNGSYTNGNVKTVGINNPRYFYTFTSPGTTDNYDKPEGEKGEQVPAVIGWADIDTGRDGGYDMPTALPEGETSDLGYLKLYVGQLGEESGGAGVRDRNQPIFNGKSAATSINKVCEGDAIDEVVLTVGSTNYTRADILLMDFAESAYTYNTSEATATDYVRGVPMSVLLDGYNDNDVVTFAAADGYDVAASGYTVRQLIDNDYMLAYEMGSSASDLTGIYETAKKDPSKYGFLRLYGSDEKGKPAKLVNSITVTAASGIDFSTSPYKHITYDGAPYNIDSITGATLTVEGPGVKASVPVSIRDLEGRDAGAFRADYTDKREGSDVTRKYEGIELYYILHNMTSGENGILLTDSAQKVLIKNRNRNTIAEFTLDQIEEAHNSETPILVAYGTSLTNGENISPFVFDKAAGADSDLGNEDGCIKLVYDKSSITDDANADYKTFGNMAYIYVAEADTPGYKHDKDPYKSPEISNYVITVTGDKIGREVNYTVSDLEGMVEYDSEGKPVSDGMGYRDEYSLANSTYWYVNEYEGVQLWKLLLKSGLDPALASDDETLVSSTATDGYPSTDKFTIKQVADPDSFGFYEKNPKDPNTIGWSDENNEVMRDEDHPQGDLIRRGYPVLLAYGVNGYPYVEKSSQEGYLSGLQNDGGPVRVISGKKQYNHANGSNQAKYLDKIIVGDDTNHYSTHKYNPNADGVYTGLAENSKLEVKILNGADADAPVLKENTYKLGEIEDFLYGGSLTTNQLKEAKIKTFYQLAKGGSAYSDLYEGINLNFFLEEIVELPGYKGTITFSNGTNDLTLSLEDVLAVNNGSNTETGMDGLAPILAYAKNGSPMVLDKDSEGYEKTITLAEGEDPITIKNDGGPLAVLFPHTDSSVSDQSLTNVTSITINLSADKYAHTQSPYDSYADYEVTIFGEGSRLGTEGKAFTLSELEGKQTIAFTGDYSVLKSGEDQTPSQTRYRGIDLYKLLTSTAVGLKSNADKVVITTSDNKSKEFTLSEIRQTYMNSVTGDSGLPVILAYGTGKAGEEDKEDGLPLVEDNNSDGYDSAYGNTGGPLRLVVGQNSAEDVNSGKNIKSVKSIEVTASEMTSWNHNSGEVYKQYRDEEVQLIVNDKDDNELFNKTYTVGEIEDNTALVERTVATVVQEFTWEGINFWKWIKQEVGNDADLSNPISVTVTAIDGYSQEIGSKFGIDGLENGIKDGENRIPILLAYGVGGYPLVIGDKSHANGEGYDATAGNNGGPLRLITHNSQGTSLTYLSRIVVVAGEGGGVEPEEPADFTIKGLTGGDIKMSVDDIKNLKNSSGDNVGQAEGDYTVKGVTKKVKGALLKNILAANGVVNENTLITLNTPDGFETTGKGASYNNITLKQAIEQKYLLAYQEWDAEAGEWKDIDDIVKNTDIHTNLRMYRNYCDATEGVDSQSDWYDECTNINAITIDVPEVTAFKEYPTSAGVRSTWMDKDNTIWVGTYGGGLYYKKAGETGFSVLNISSTPALMTNYTSAVAADAEGGIWVSQNASYTQPDNNQGVLYIKDGQVTQYTVENNPGTIADNYVQAIQVGEDGKVWFGSFGGLTIYDPANDSWVTYSKADKENFPATSVCTITLDGNDAAWIGFYPDNSGTEENPVYAGGFCRITADGTVSNVVNAGGAGDAQFAQSWVRSIAIDQKGTVWAVAAGTNIEDNVGGVIWKWQISKDKLSTYKGKEVFADYLNGSNTTEVRTVAVDAEGSLWFGTSADGVLKVSNPQIVDGKMAVDAQYAKETGSWSADNMNNVYSIDFWNGGTAYVGTSGGILVLGDEPQGGGDEPGVEPAGDATPEDAALTVTGDALARDGYFSIKGIKNAEGVVKTAATFDWKNSSGTTGTSEVEGATLENIFNDVIGMADGAEVGSVEIQAADGYKATYTAEEALGTDLSGNKAMFIWTEGTDKVQKVIRGQFTEGEANRGKWVDNTVKITVNKKIASPEEVVEEINALPETVTLADKEAIEKARADYEALSDAEKESIPATSVLNLKVAEAKLVAAEAEARAEEAEARAAEAQARADEAAAAADAAQSDASIAQEEAIQAKADAATAQAEAAQAKAEAEAAQAVAAAAQAAVAQAEAEAAESLSEAAAAKEEAAAAKEEAAEAKAEAEAAKAEAEKAKEEAAISQEAAAAAWKAAEQAQSGSDAAVAKADLAAAIVNAATAGITEAKYTKASYTAYRKAFKNARAVLRKTRATADEFKSAKKALNKAKKALVKKAKNTLTAKTKTIKAKAKTVKKKAKSFSAKKAFTVKKAKGKVTYKKVKGNSKITVSSKGKVRIKKGLKKGVYKVRVNVKAAGNDKTRPAVKKVILKVIVR